MINKISLDNNLYIEAYLACPVCFEQDNNCAAGYWEHDGCGGKIYVGDDANFFCEKCGERRHLSNCKYSNMCCYMDESEATAHKIIFDKPNDMSLARVISIAGQLTTVAGLPWLKKFIDNLE